MPDPSEFQRLVALDRVGPRPSRHSIEATAEERAALAARFGLLSLESLTAHVTLVSGDAGRAVNLNARFQAKLTQACVVTLEPVPAEIAEDFELVYARIADGADTVDVDPDPEGATVEPLPPGAIDIGEAVAQQLSLALDPYPRAPSAKVPPSLSEPQSPAAGPFSALGAFKAKSKPRRS